MRFTGRIRLVGSVSELETACNVVTTPNHTTKPSVVVTKTFNDADGQLEAEIFLRRERILTIKRGETQCVSCAVRLAHLVGAAVVVA